jgi:hypothetical protein
MGELTIVQLSLLCTFDVKTHADVEIQMLGCPQSSGVED